jgi:hypothetical protein
LIAPVLLFGLLSLAWMIARATGVFPAFLPEASEVWLLILVWSLLFVLIAAMGFLSTSANGAAELEARAAQRKTG